MRIKKRENFFVKEKVKQKNQHQTNCTYKTVN